MSYQTNDAQKQAFQAALGALTEFYNAVVADLREQLAAAERDRDHWHSRYLARPTLAASVSQEDPQ